MQSLLLKPLSFSLWLAQRSRESATLLWMWNRKPSISISTMTREENYPTRPIQAQTSAIAASIKLIQDDHPSCRTFTTTTRLKCFLLTLKLCQDFKKSVFFWMSGFFLAQMLSKEEQLCVRTRTLFLDVSEVSVCIMQKRKDQFNTTKKMIWIWNVNPTLFAPWLDNNSQKCLNDLFCVAVFECLCPIMHCLYIYLYI